MISDLRYLGLTLEEIKLLRDLIRAQHPKTGMSTASSCICGSGSGGPGNNGLCSILTTLSESGMNVRLGRPTHRDSSVCDHTYDGKSIAFEYDKKLYCELCWKELI